MALMIPHIPFDTQSEGEMAIFNSLQAGLDEDYVVFHSVRWISSAKRSQGEADFLILHRRFGIMVLEVKAGNIRCEGRRWFQQNRATLIEKEIQDPMNQADNSKFKFIELLSEANPSIQNCLVCHAVWYPSIKRMSPLPPHYSTEILLDIHSLLDPQTELETAFKYWENRIFASNFPQSVFDQIKFLIAPEFHSVPSIRANFDFRERMFITLTKDQARIMDFLEEQKVAVITGSAGTGKTMLGLEKANRLGVKNESTLFLCFNEALREHLQENNPIKSVHFKTIFELASQFITFNPEIELNELTELLATHLIDNRKSWPYIHVIIDEAQDFNSLFIEVIKDITSGCFYAFYDKNQSIYQIDELNWANNAECKLTLHTNCRNTKEIARTSARNIGLDSRTFINSPVKGEQSFIAEYDVPAKGIILVENLVNHLIKDKKATPEDIVILTMSGLNDSILKSAQSILKLPLSKFLKKGKLCFNTVDAFKGLESGYVILIDIDVASYAIDHYRNRLYIGCSRAKHGLYMLLDNPAEGDFAIAMHSIESKKKIKKTRSSFYQKLAVSELQIN